MAAIGEPVVEPEPEPEPPEPEPVIEADPEPSGDCPDVDEAPPGLSVDAFKDIKPVSFGGIVVEPSEQAAQAATQPEPSADPAVEPEPVARARARHRARAVVEPEPVAASSPSRSRSSPSPSFEPISYPIEDRARHRARARAGGRAIAAAVAEPVAADEPKAKKRGFRLPEPGAQASQLRQEEGAAGQPASTAPKAKGGLKLPQITLPPNLQGPLSDVERKIVLGSVVAIVAAAALRLLDGALRGRGAAHARARPRGRLALARRLAPGTPDPLCGRRILR